MYCSELHTFELVTLKMSSPKIVRVGPNGRFELHCYTFSTLHLHRGTYGRNFVHNESIFPSNLNSQTTG
jgi:hypothetical protein